LIQGKADRIGAGAGAGFNINVPLPAGDESKGLTDADYAYVFEEVVMPVIRQFGPQLLIVPAGFDAGVWDRDLPVGGYSLTARGYCYMVRAVRDYAVANSHRQSVGLVSAATLGTANATADISQDDSSTNHIGLILCLEGGYNTNGMAECVSAVMNVLLEKCDDNEISISAITSTAEVAVGANSSALAVWSDPVHPDVVDCVNEVKEHLKPYWTL
jgi:acetoin utilization deacetylase AcuC-like enzyme